MEPSRRNALMLRLSIFSAGAIGLFWLVWYLIAGEVPVVSEIQMTPEWTLAMPFVIPRWTDVLIGPIWAVLLVRIFTDEKLKKDDIAFGLVSGLVSGLKHFMPTLKTVGRWLSATDKKEW